LRRLGQAGIDTAAAQASGQLEVWSWNEAYLAGGCFDQERMLRLVGELLGPGPAGRFAVTRLWADMEWALAGYSGVEQLVEYETRVNQVLPRHADEVVCAYDLSRFSAAVMMDILRAHPLVSVGGRLRPNPFFVPPDELLAELRQRPA
jgi:hypothetical protein